MDNKSKSLIGLLALVGIIVVATSVIVVKNNDANTASVLDAFKSLFGAKIINPSTIALVETNPHLGDYVTFKSTYYPSNLDQKEKGGVRVQVLCYQNGNLVYGEAGHYDMKFLLGGAMSIWFQGGGEADCHADLYYWSYQGGQKFNPLAFADFHALGRR